MIIESNKVGINWLCHVLHVPWFGDIGIYHDPETGDVVPVYYNQAGDMVAPVWS
jgi:hypothetical protein